MSSTVIILAPLSDVSSEVLINYDNSNGLHKTSLIVINSNYNVSNSFLLQNSDILTWPSMKIAFYVSPLRKYL